MSKIAEELQLCSETPFLDARFFCEAYQGVPNETQVRDFVKRRKEGEPVSKIIGKRGFWKRDFIVSKEVLDPRPDSETIIETILKIFSDKTESYRILDIGTGSGCLLLSLLDEYQNAQGVGIDKSTSALQVARQNSNTERAQFVEADFRMDSFAKMLGKFDIIVSNPPYIKTDDIAGLSVAVRRYDPLLALDGGVDGLDAYRCLAKVLPYMVSERGAVFFEIGQGQEEDVCSFMQSAGFKCVQQVKDLGQIIRVLVFLKE